MLIVCPSCASEYRIDADKVGMEGRSVRCAACRETWFISPADVLAGHEAELVADADAQADPVVDAAWEEATASVRHASDAPDPQRPAPHPGDLPSGACQSGAWSPACHHPWRSD